MRLTEVVRRTPHPGGLFIWGIMKPLKNKRHEKFALNLFQGMSQKDAALEAGYKSSRVDVTASELVRNSKIFNRILELQKKAESDAIMSVRERKERLSEIARARLTDYITCGPDRDLILVGPESPNTAAFQEVTSRTEFDKDGAGVAVITKLKLHEPIKAIAELNKMEGEYPKGEYPKGEYPISKEIALAHEIQVEVDAKGKLVRILSRLAARTREVEGDREPEPEGS